MECRPSNWKGEYERSRSDQRRRARPEEGGEGRRERSARPAARVRFETLPPAYIITLPSSSRQEVVREHERDSKASTEREEGEKERGTYGTVDAVTL